MPKLRQVKHKFYGCRPDRLDHRDARFKLGMRAGPLPASVDHRDKCPAVMNQGDLGACTAHGITGVLRFNLIAKGKQDEALSRLQLYFDERKVEGTTNSDSGAAIRDGIKCAAKLGVAPEVLWPYDIKNFKKQPPRSVYVAARQVEALSYERVDVSVVALQTALASGFPVVIGIQVFESFEADDVAKTGMVPVPGQSEAPLGGHCMYVVGYGQKPNCFTVRNSWGTAWGDKGDCYIPYDYLGDPNLGDDYWVVKAIS